MFSIGKAMLNTKIKNLAALDAGKKEVKASGGMSNLVDSAKGLTPLQVMMDAAPTWVTPHISAPTSDPASPSRRCSAR